MQAIGTSQFGPSTTLSFCRIKVYTHREQIGSAVVVILHPTNVIPIIIRVFGMTVYILFIVFVHKAHVGREHHLFVIGMTS